MDFYELTMSLPQPQVEAMDAMLTQLGAVGITYSDAEDAPIYEPLPGEMPLWEDIKVIALYDDLKLYEQSKQWLQVQFPQLEVLATKLKDQVWERVWMDHFKPMRFGQNSWVVPDGFDVVDESAVNLILDPGLAFGTGTHPTTALCLEWLDLHDVKDKRLVDFGCGSGVLAIMALLHGAKEVICVDIDDQAIEATLQNATKNGVADGIKVVQPDQVASIKNQHGVLANILAAPLMQLSTVFSEMLEDKGFIVLSGILAEQQKQVMDKYESCFVDIEGKIEQDWCRVSARKR
ncbi:50S ribosomal protein L11 methyltransferase [Marinicella rhabdoformis]|uniref:50S ribosomal protein L11 methyltransferase n=1 Tax=Marinicella rhabdoformis TaxID=2580566 RepID=UPI0012AECA25|nr:50S ribosomal protein L11 methyltransferase [Marinicella rhabdoformis]